MKKKKIKNLFLSKESLIAISVSLFIYIYSTYFYYFEFQSQKFDNLSIETITNNFNIKTFGQSLVLFVTIMIIFFYKNFIIKNCKEILDYFVISFVFLIIIYNLKNNNILSDTLFVCDLGFFYYTKFLFSENSHFAIISSSIITFLFFNIDSYFKKKIILFFYLLFFIFSIGSMSLTFYFSIISSILVSLVFCRNKTKSSIYSLVILFIFVNLYFYYEKDFLKFDNSETKHVYNCKTNSEMMIKNYKLDTDQNYFTGAIIPNESKLKEFFKKDINNLSISVQLYSLYFAKNSITKYPLGIGLNNYIIYRDVFDKEQIIDVSEHPNDKIIFERGLFNSISAHSIKLNRNSGSNNLSKIIVEFGLLGLLLIGLIFFILCSNRLDNSIKVAFVTLILNQLVIRGTGYYNSGFLIMIILLILIFFDIQAKKKGKRPLNVKNF